MPPFVLILVLQLLYIFSINSIIGVEIHYQAGQGLIAELGTVSKAFEISAIV